MISHRVLRPVVALAVGFTVAFYAYDRVTDPRPRQERAREEAVVQASRDILRAYVGTSAELRIVDPVAPNRRVGKVYIYPAGSGWEISGLYKRGEKDRWHPYLMRLDEQLLLVKLSLRDDDPGLRQKAGSDPRLMTEP